MEKKCACCGIVKNISEFHKNSRNKDGLHSYCKSCNASKAKKFNKTEKGKENTKKAQQKQAESGYFRYGKGAIINMSKSASLRGKEFNLTQESLAKWWKTHKDTCYYCNLNKDQYIHIRDYIREYTGDNWNILRFKKFFQQEVHAKISDMTIDRRDNSLGYDINNIVKSCWICNSLKSDFYTENEMKTIGKIIMQNLQEDILSESRKKREDQ